MPRFIARIRVLAVACLATALIIIGRLYLLQIVHGESYAARADAQFLSQKQPLLDRNKIFFSDKEGNEIVAATTQKVGTSTDKHQRFYPGGQLAAQEIGFVAYNNDDTQKGRYGLERYYEQTLSESETDSYTNFFVELFGSVKTIFSGQDQTGDLVTTIEPSTQAELERTLDEYNTQWHSKVSGGIIMDPKTGEIVAMAVNPTFSLNEFNKETDPLIFANPLVENVYEMGSIIKPLTVAAGLDSGAISANTTYNDTGCIQVDDKKICNFDLKARGVIPVVEILKQSLNVGASFVATKMGQQVQREYFLDKYKFNQETGVDLPGEIRGLTDNLKSKGQVEYDTASFGQGIAMTPIETVRALASLANGGVLVTPHLVKEVKLNTGATQTVGWGEPEQILKQETALSVSRMLTEVVDTALANGTIKTEHYSVAAKTGTAQIANPGGGGYYTDRFLHSFFGYFPSYDAKFIVFLFALEPQGAPFASQTLAPPFHALTQFLINYYAIPPDR